eukprot:387228-Rhodomonas_salina.2
MSCPSCSECRFSLRARQVLGAAFGPWSCQHSDRRGRPLFILLRARASAYESGNKNKNKNKNKGERASGVHRKRTDGVHVGRSRLCSSPSSPDVLWYAHVRCAQITGVLNAQLCWAAQAVVFIPVLF